MVRNQRTKVDVSYRLTIRPLKTEQGNKTRITLRNCNLSGMENGVMEGKKIRGIIYIVLS